MPANGSGINFKPRSTHLGRKRPSAGVGGELSLLRTQLEAQLGNALLSWICEYTNPVVADVDAFVLAVAPPETGEGSLVYQKGSSTPLDGVVASSSVPYGRNVTVTTTGADTEFSFPFDVVVEGKRNGVRQTETITVAAASSPGTFAGVKIFDEVTKVTIPECGAGAGGGAISVGFGARLGVPGTMVTRAGLANVSREVVAGSVVTNGVFSVANSSYTPNSAPNGSTSYAITYEVAAPVVKVDRLPSPGAALECLSQLLLLTSKRRPRAPLLLFQKRGLLLAELEVVVSSLPPDPVPVDGASGRGRRGLLEGQG